MTTGSVVFEKKQIGTTVTHLKKRFRNKNNGPFHDELRKLM